jgi:hypothetical protein
MVFIQSLKKSDQFVFIYILIFVFESGYGLTDTRSSQAWACGSWCELVGGDGCNE